jgi:predicted AAA+ superfamily ATPase
VNANELHNFITGNELLDFIEAQTGVSPEKFKRRDFIEPLIDFCLDGNYTAKLGIVYGLRSTGKTVGMLQAAEELIKQGHKVAYARFNYEKTGMNDVNDELIRLVKDGYSHFFLDAASYLSGFVNESAEWADMFVPRYRIKIIISGTDSFMLWTAQRTSLFHRYVLFATNWNSFPEYKRVMGKPYDNYKRQGGIFTAEDMSEFIQSAVVDNLLHTIEHCMEDANRKTEYTDRLYGLNSATVYKAVISIFKCAAEDSIIEHFVEKSGQKNIVDLGEAVKGLSAGEKRDIKKRVAESIEIYRNFTPVKDPLVVIEALVEFLVKIGCLYGYSTATNEFGEANAYTFTHNALMNYAIAETIQGILKLKDIDQPEFIKGIKQAAEGALNESIVFAHVLHGAKKDEKVFKYRDLENREIDTVVINREAKTLRLIEVKSKTKIDKERVRSNDARHLFDDEILKNIGIDGTFKVTRVLVYMGTNGSVIGEKDVLYLVNIKDLLNNYKDLGQFFNRMAVRAKTPKTKPTLMERLEDGKRKVAGQEKPAKKAKKREL